MTLESSKGSYSFTYKVINYDYFDQMITVQNIKFAKKAQTNISLGFLLLEI